MKNNHKISKHTSESAGNIYQELDSHRVGTLGTVDAADGIQISAVYYTVDESFVISFATKKETKKHRNIQKNNLVQLLIFDEEYQMTLQVTGEAQEVKSNKTKTDIVENMYWVASRSDFEAPPISKLFAGDYVAYQILPKRISMAIFLRPQKGGYDMYETLNFEVA